MKSICIFYVTNIIEQFFKYKTDIIIKGLSIYIYCTCEVYNTPL